MNFKRIAILLCSCLVALSMKAQQTTEDLTRYVNPLIGTKEMGHVFPGACVPFGMVQLSPDTDTIPYAVNGKYTGTDWSAFNKRRENSTFSRKNIDGENQ